MCQLRKTSGELERSTVCSSGGVMCEMSESVQVQQPRLKRPLHHFHRDLLPALASLVPSPPKFLMAQAGGIQLQPGSSPEQEGAVENSPVPKVSVASSLPPCPGGSAEEQGRCLLAAWGPPGVVQCVINSTGGDNVVFHSSCVSSAD